MRVASDFSASASFTVSPARSDATAATAASSAVVSDTQRSMLLPERSISSSIVSRSLSVSISGSSGIVVRCALRLVDDLDRRGAQVVGAVAELSFVVVTPAVGHVPAGHRARVIVAGAERAERESARHRDGHVARRTGDATAELAPDVVAPAERVAARGESAGIESTRADRREADAAGDRDRKGVVLCIAGAELALI